MLKTIIIDDQEFCTEVIKDILEKNDNVEITAICNSAKEGLKAIKKLDPDLVILDVEMPEMSGFELLQNIKDPSFSVIFTTSFDKYSIQAIRYSALDYLLKPVVDRELNSAIDRIKEGRNKLMGKKFNELFKNLSEIRRPLTQVALPSSDGLVFITVSDIVHCESDSNYTTLFMKTKERLVITKTLKEVEGLLSGSDFFRIHHSHLINVSHIKRYVRGNAGYVIMSDGSHINIARNRKEEFLKQFVHF
jgi:two-component system LytT family response regulator